MRIRFGSVPAPKCLPKGAWPGTRDTTCRFSWFFFVVAIGVGSSIFAAADEPRTASTVLGDVSLRQAVIRASEQNRAKLASGVLVWERKSAEDGFIPGRTLDHQGRGKLMWRGEKFRSEYMDDGLRKEKGAWVKSPFGEVKAYNGKEFREIPNIPRPKDIALSREPKLRQQESWLAFVGWMAGQPASTFAKFDKYDFIQQDWSLDTSGGSAVVKVHRTNKQNGKAETVWYDLARGGEMTHRETRYPDGRIEAEAEIDIREVAPGLWFPVALSSKAFDEQQPGKTTLLHDNRLRLTECRFNDGDIPDSAFEIPIEDGMEITDYRAGARITYDTAQVASSERLQSYLDWVTQSSDFGVTKSAPTVATAGRAVPTSPVTPVADAPSPVSSQRGTWVGWAFLVAGALTVAAGFYRLRRQSGLAVRAAN
jgi:hypothetical protein